MSELGHERRPGAAAPAVLDNIRSLIGEGPRYLINRGITSASGWVGECVCVCVHVHMCVVNYTVYATLEYVCSPLVTCAEVM